MDLYGHVEIFIEISSIFIEVSFALKTNIILYSLKMYSQDSQ